MTAMTSSVAPPVDGVDRQPVAGPEPAAGGWPSRVDGAAGAPAEETIRRLLARFAVALRVTCTAAALVVVGVTLTADLAGRWLLGAVAAVVASTAALAVILPRRPAARWVVCLDVAVTAVVCLLQGLLLPPALVAQGSSWVAAAASIAVITANLTLPVPAALLACLTIAGGWAAGSTLGAGAGSGVPHLVILVLQTSVTAVLTLVLVRAARAADRALAAHEAAVRAGAVEAARRLDERGLRRRLHDTVLATLTMVGSGSIGSGSATVRARAAEDLAVLEDLASVPRTTGSARLDHRLTESANRVRPLLEVATELDACEVPAPVAEAVVGAVNEALVNVAKHAEVDAATVRLRADGEGGVVVEVVDEGVGFDPARIGRHHFGLRESVAGRMTEVGGWSRVRSAAGGGCTVVLGWPGG